MTDIETRNASLEKRASASSASLIVRKEDERLITGHGRFSDDFSLAGQAHAVMVRSPHPHARILGIDAARAKAMPGVLGVFTGADCLADGLGAIPHDPLPKTKYDMKLTGPRRRDDLYRPAPAAAGRQGAPCRRGGGDGGGRDHGAGARCRGSGRGRLRGAARRLPFRGRDGAGRAGDLGRGARQHSGRHLVRRPRGDRQGVRERRPRRGDGLPHRPRHRRADRAARRARRTTTRQSGRYTLHAGSGGAVRQKRELAAVLGIAPESLRVLSHDVGGNFGTRNRVFVEFGLVLWAARKLGRPVKFTATRSEAFLSDYQGRDLVTKVELALRQDGRFLAMRATNISNVGARCVSLSPLSKGAGLIPGSYDIPAATLRAMAVFTNTMPTQAYRSSGRPEVTFAIERLIDIAAARLGIDRIELRRKNLVEPQAMPYRNAVGMTYDSGRYEENMDWAMDIADWKGFEQRRREAAKRGKLLGRGLANYVESSIGAPNEQARITVRPEGRVDVVIGTQPSGQGHETSFAQVVSDLLHVPVESVKIILGDTDVVKVGGGSHSGRSMRHAATVFSKAAPDLIAKGKRIAAVILGSTPDQIEFSDGRFLARETNRTFDFLELAKEAATHDLPRDLEGRHRGGDRQRDARSGFSRTAAPPARSRSIPTPARCRITRYASVDDVGRCINPLIVHGQTHGAIAQGVGQALWERCYVEPDSGQPLVGSLMDYGMPRADTLPAFRTEIAEVLSPDQSARHQGGRRRRHHGGARGRHQRYRRCAARLRRAPHQYAGDALQYLEDNPGRQGGRAQDREEMMPFRARFSAGDCCSARPCTRANLAEIDADHRAVCARSVGGRHCANDRERARAPARAADRGREQAGRRRLARPDDPRQGAARRRYA